MDQEEEAEAFHFVPRAQYDIGGRRVVTADHPLVRALLETAKNGQAVVVKQLPNSSVRVWLRSQGFLVRTHKNGDVFECWCEPLTPGGHDPYS